MNAVIKVKNITPITQIEGNTNERIKFLDNLEVKIITIKTLTKLINGIPVDIPVYTANGFRGLLRREASSILVEKYISKGHNIKAKDFHLMFAGGGNDYQSQSFEIEEKVRELNPVISIFGTSLAIEGKLITTHLEPENPLVVIREDEEKGLYAYSNLIKKFIFTKKDDILERTEYGRFLTKEDIIAWEQEVEKSQEKRRKERADKDLVEKKTKKKAIQSILGKYYIIPNTTFKGFMGTKYPLTDIEKGLLIKALERIVYNQLGSTKNLGFGICDYEIGFASGSKIIAKSKDNNLFEKDVNLILSDDDEGYVKAFESWLENIGPENIEISKILVEKEK